jgi:hypothetical protein
VYSSLVSPNRVSLPRKGSPGRPAHRPFRRLARRSLTLRPAHSRGHQFVTRYPKASDISSPPCLLRLLPAGANRQVGLAPTRKRRLVTAHPHFGRSLTRRGFRRGRRNADLRFPSADDHISPPCSRESGSTVEWGSGAAAVGRACLLPPLSSGGALVARPWLRFHSPLIEPDMRISLHPALGQDLTPSPTARRAQAGSDARARRSRRGAGVDSCRPYFVWSCA